MPDILKPAVRYIDTADKFALLNINHADYMRHIVSHFAAERMKHVKQYLGEVLSNYRAGGPVRREYPHDAGMAGKTKATTKGSPVEIKEIKRITNYAMSVAGGQGYQPGGRFLVAFSRRGYLSRNASSASRFGLVRGEGLSKDSRFWRAFSRWRSIMDNAIACNSSLVIVCACKAMRRSSSHHGADSDYSDSLALRRWSSSRATVISCPISSAALMPICSTLARASSEDTRGFSPLPSAWRLAISPRTAVTIKFALVSPGCRDASMPLTTSCGNLAFSCCDLLLTELLDMFAPPINNGMQCNTKVNTKKDLKWYSPKCNVNTTSADTCNSAIETTKPRKCRYHSQGF
ncbi:hypothetical protein PO415_11465 [Escherichia coli]|nr:hypothetical protein [Escherichia coli]